MRQSVVHYICCYKISKGLKAKASRSGFEQSVFMQKHVTKITAEGCITPPHSVGIGQIATEGLRNISVLNCLPVKARYPKYVRQNRERDREERRASEDSNET